MIYDLWVLVDGTVMRPTLLLTFSSFLLRTNFTDGLGIDPFINRFGVFNFQLLLTLVIVSTIQSTMYY